MIRLREAIDRGLRHRWFRPLCLILLVLLLGLMFVHAVQDNDHMTTEVGEICIALTVMFAFIVIVRLGWSAVVRLLPVAAVRGPPAIQWAQPPAAFPAVAPVRLRL